MECPKLKVSGSDYKDWDLDGTYYITAEKARRSLSKPVYKMQGYDKFIYHYPGSGGGWFIGCRENLIPYEEEGSTYRTHYWFKGKSFYKESWIELGIHFTFPHIVANYSFLRW